MTVFPEAPKLEKVSTLRAREMRCLAEDHLTYVKMPFGFSLEILIKAGYLTDGASVPEWGTSIIGTPWDMPRLLAALVHDALYSRKWKIRWLCDFVYWQILKSTDHPTTMREVEYDAIRLFGWRAWCNVSRQERRNAKALVFVRWRRTKNISNSSIVQEHWKGIKQC